MRDNRSMASLYSRSAVAPSASIAAPRAWIPSAQSVPAARASSANWASGPVARCGWPLRTAASISSASSQIDGRGQSILVAAKPVVALCPAPLVGNDPEPFAALEYVLLARLAERHCLGVLSAPVRQRDRGTLRELTA